MAAKYSRSQLQNAVRRNLVVIADIVTDAPGNVAEQRLHGFIDGMLLNIYLLHCDGRTVSRSQAWKMVPADHLDTCKKYVAEAERLGLIALTDDQNDGRRKNVSPTQSLIALIEARAGAALDSAAAILRDRRS